MFKLIFRYTKLYKKEFFLSLISIIIESLLELSCPFLMNRLLSNGLILNNDGTYALNIDEVIKLSIFMTLFTILAFIFGYIFAKSVAKYSKLVTYKIREDEYKKIYELSLSSLNNFSYSSILTRLTSDIEILSHTLSTSFRPLFRSPVMLIGIIYISIFTSLELSIAFLIALPLETVIMFLIIKKVKIKFINIQSNLDKINEVNKETITNIKTIKSLNKESYQESYYDKFNLKSKKTQNEAFSLNALIHPTQDLVQFSLVIALLYLGYNLSLDNYYSYIVINISMFLNYLTQTLATVSMVSNVALEFNKARASSFRINEILSIKNDEEEINNELKINNGNIEFKNVSFSFNNLDNLVLKDINFKLNKGDKIGIIGETSSGKTSLAYLLLKLYKPTLGNIYIDNLDINSLSHKEISKNISIVFQYSFFFKDTILNNLKWGNENISKEEIIKIVKDTDCYDFIFNLKDNFNFILSEGGTNLSEGEKQRLSIARALINKPKILVLDDAFSHLDKLTENKIKNYLFSQKDLTLINISSKLSSVSNLDKIYLLENGKFILNGNLDELKDKSNLVKKIYSYENMETF